MQHMISLLVEDNPGVLARISGMFTRRAINITSLTVSPCEKRGLSRMTVVINGSERELEQVRKQLNNLIEVIQVRELSSEDAIVRDLCLLKVSAKKEQRAEILQLAESYGARVLDATLSTLTFELADEPRKIDRFVEIMRHFGIKQLLRSGICAIARD
ncbi:acetolactate synthase small subunit [Methanosarcinales archaeon]|nr:MAG: acetolactate synthase small subunit [Methanosarcinales archaeon]